MRQILLYFLLVFSVVANSQSVGQVAPATETGSFVETNADTSSFGDFIRFIGEDNQPSPAPASITIQGPGLHVHHEKFGILKDSYIYGSFGSLNFASEVFIAHSLEGPSDDFIRLTGSALDAQISGPNSFTSITLDANGLSFRENITNSTTGIRYFDDYSTEYLASSDEEILTSKRMVRKIVSDTLATAGQRIVVVVSPTTGNYTVELSGMYSRIHRLDLAGAPTSVTLTVSNPMAGGVYTIHYQNANDVTYPANFKDPGGTALGTVTYTTDRFVTFYYDGTDYFLQ